MALLVFVAVGSTAQNKVKTMKLFVNKKISEKAEYNSDGKLNTRETLVNDVPEMWFKEVNVYSANMLQESEHYLNGQRITGFEYFYNEYNQIERRSEKENDSVVGYTYFEYNDSRAIVSETNYSEGDKNTRTDYHYNANGLVCQRSESIIDQDGAVILSESYEYNSNGLLVRVVGLNKTDTLSDIRYSYNANGNKTGQYVISHSDTALVVQWNYKKGMNLPFSEQHVVDGLIVRQTKIKYNKAGLKKQEKTTEYRIFTGKLKPETTIKKFEYTWYK